MSGAGWQDVCGETPFAEKRVFTVVYFVVLLYTGTGFVSPLSRIGDLPTLPSVVGSGGGPARPFHAGATSPGLAASERTHTPPTPTRGPQYAFSVSWCSPSPMAPRKGHPCL